MVPGLNVAVATNDAARNIRAGNYAEGAVDAAGAIGAAVPVVGGAFKAGVRGIAKEGGNLASHGGLLHNPPPQPLRSFTDDYPQGARADAEGRLTQDIDGRKIDRGATVAGRADVGEADQAVGAAEIPAHARRTTGQAPKREQLEGDSGRFLIDYEAQTGRYRGIRGIVVADDLSDDQAIKALAHEVAHSIDFRAVPARTLDAFHDGKWGIQSGDEKVQQQLYRIYTDLNNPKVERWTPLDEGYTKTEEARELWAEAIRAYMADPNYIKTVAPETAAVIRPFANSNKRLNRIIHFNSIGAGAAAGAAVDQANEPDKNEQVHGEGSEKR